MSLDGADVVSRKVSSFASSSCDQLRLPGRTHLVGKEIGLVRCLEDIRGGVLHRSDSTTRYLDLQCPEGLSTCPTSLL